MTKKTKELHERAMETAKNYVKAEADLIEILQEMDRTKGFRELGCKSLFEYCRQALRLSESVCFNLITVARKAEEVPQLKQKIANQEITLSNARLISPVLTRENQEKWLSAAQDLSKRELEKEIVKEKPELAVQERARVVSEDRVEVTVGLSEEIFSDLKRVQDLVSTKIGAPADLEEALGLALKEYIQKHDPVAKASRAKEPVPGQVSVIPLAGVRTALPALLKHRVNVRDQGRCTYQHTSGERCSERRWLETHHLKPVAEGGSHTLENLETLCRGHHQMVHHKI